MSNLYNRLERIAMLTRLGFPEKAERFRRMTDEEFETFAAAAEEKQEKYRERRKPKTIWNRHG